MTASPISLVILAVPVAQIIYPAYNKEGKDGKLLIALFSPLIGVFLKVLLRICVQRLYSKCIYPGYSYVSLTPLYCCSAVMFRVLQADLGSLQFITVLGIFHGAAEVIEVKFFFQMTVAINSLLILALAVSKMIYPAYNKQGKDGKLLIALFSPLIGVLLKVSSRVCVQRLYWKCTHPGYSCVSLTPLYCCSAVMFRVLQADLGSLQFITVLGIIHGAAEVIERSTMVVIDNTDLSCDLQKNISSLGKFS